MKNIKLNDLFYVILVGFLASIVVGIGIGIIEYVLYITIGLTLRIFFFIGVYFLAGYIRRQYVESAMIYQILAVIFTINGYFLSIIISNVLDAGIDQLGYFLNFIYSLDFLLYYFDPRVIFSSGAYDLIEYLFLFISCTIAYIKTK